MPAAAEPHPVGVAPWLRVAFVTLIAVLAAASWVSWTNARHMNETTRSVAHTHAARTAIAHVLSAVQDAETGQRGYLITGEVSELAPYRAARESIDGDLDRLRTLTHDNAAQAEAIEELVPLIHDRLDELERAILVRKRGEHHAARAMVREGRGTAIMDHIRSVLARMERTEDALLGQRTAAADVAARTASVTFALADFLALALIAALYVVVARDVRRRAAANAERSRLLDAERAARHEAEMASHAKDTFLATLSHELRTPLTPILAWVRMLRQDTLDDDGTRRALEVIERSVRTEAQLVEDILDVSRIIAGKMRIEVRPVELPDVIDAALDVVRPSAEAKGVRLQKTVDSEVGLVSGDPDRLQQVLWNLLTNAIKFTPRGGRVHVVLERVESHVEITVSDSGQGIPAAFLPHVFERFRQADGSTTRAHGGLGLGLAIVRHVVELHGGTVAVQSPGPDDGAAFTITLPRLQLAAGARGGRRRHPTAAAAALALQQTLAGIRILLVDDEPDANDAMGGVLRACGAEVRAATSAADARAVLTAWRPQVIVSDIGMPGEDGYGFLASLRATDAGLARIPVIALTAYASVDDRVRTLSAGFRAHVGKPVDPAELVAVIGSLTPAVPAA